MTEEKNKRLRNILQTNQFIVPSYGTYGGLSGFHDYGILGTKVKLKLLNLWRSFFLDKNEIDEIETPIIIPYDVLYASGHVSRFTDYIVKDKDGRVHRADHLVKDYFRDNGMDKLADQVDGWTQQKLESEINKYKMVSSPGHAGYIKVETKNLMYSIPSAASNSSGSSNNTPHTDFLRPELAQGIFINYGICKQFMKKDLPFGLAQVGKSYRKEISPQSFVRMREFTQAEIEFFTDPLNKTHSNYDSIKDYCIPILTGKMQENNEKVRIVTISDAIESGIISHQIMGYFLANIHQFCLKIGLKEEKIRFRQHLPSEMAHYASECWDLETYVNNDWLECIGCADRGSYDLRAHGDKGVGNCKGVEKRKLETPIVIKTLKIKVNKSVVTSKYNDATNSIVKYFYTLNEEELINIKNTLQDTNNGMLTHKVVRINIDELEYVITKDMILFSETEEVTKYEEFIPHSIEPSFGIDRILYSIFEHNLWIREGDTNGKVTYKNILSLPKILSPYDIAIFCLQNKKDMMNIVNKIKNKLMDSGIKCYTDTSSVRIGKKYVRSDEIGVKFTITVDPGSLDDNKVTIRDRDTLSQNRINIDEIESELNKLYR
uniref:glycine--tRNA ligase n=1 Tax=Pithovirus LCPAC101 TaxID=2506586 RepID=A0A481Z248_9VIRU|nr:MAG: class II glycyl-tRNA synthetase [Pithovirus LCPAC101]